MDRELHQGHDWPRRLSVAGTAQGGKLLRVTVVAPGSDDLPRGRDPAYYGKEVREWNPYRYPWSAVMADDMVSEGKIVTFYSFKGGTGRTMALANVAWILASDGLKVLVVDMTAPLTGYPVKSRTWPLAAGKPFQGLPGAALGGLGMAGAHPRRREVGARLSEPLLQVVDFRLKPVLR
jgi:hypothetical protein